VSYLLDSNVCIALINGTSNRIRRRYFQAAGHGTVPFTSSIVAHELWYGVQDAQAAGEIRAVLEGKGKRIGEYDTLIAGLAFCRNLVLVTTNTREFGRVRGLVVEDWSV
jgi:tRNA(fMet)-specific endonuclease VapC